MKILIWHDKHGDVYFHSDPDDNLDDAFYRMFELIDSAGYYEYMEEEADQVDIDLHLLATHGRKHAAKRLISRRQGFEYEGYNIEDTQ